MRRDGGGVHGGKFSTETQQWIGPQRNQGTEGQGRERRQPDLGEASLGDGHAAFEADGHKQVNRQPDIERLWKFQVALRQRGDEAEREEQHGGRKQVGADGVEDFHGQLPVFGDTGGMTVCFGRSSDSTTDAAMIITITPSETCVSMAHFVCAMSIFTPTNVNTTPRPILR